MKRNGFQTNLALNLWIGYNALNFALVIFLLFMNFPWLKIGFNGEIVLLAEGLLIFGGLLAFLQLDKYFFGKGHSVRSLNFNPLSFIKRFYNNLFSKKHSTNESNLKVDYNQEEEYAWNKLESLESKNVNILTFPGKDGAEMDLLCPNCRKVFSIYSDSGGRTARIPGTNKSIGWMTIGIISDKPSRSMSGSCPHCNKHVSCNFDYDRMVIEIGDDNQNKKEYSIPANSTDQLAEKQEPEQPSSSRYTCAVCGERWLDENLINCRVCGEKICFRCEKGHRDSCGLKL